MKELNEKSELYKSIYMDEKGNGHCSLEITDIEDLCVVLAVLDAKYGETCDVDKLITATAERNGWLTSNDEDKIRQMDEWKDEEHKDSFWDEVWCADKNGNLLALGENGWEIRRPHDGEWFIGNERFYL